MDTNSIFGLMDFLIIAAGLYIVYSWYLLMYKGEIKEGVLVSQGWAKKCKDLDGYRKFIGTKLLALAVVAFLSGGVCLYSDYVKPVPASIYLGVTALFFIVLIWFITQTKKAQTQFFYS